MAISYPPIFINNYIREKLGELLPPANVTVDIPFFPTTPSTIEQLTSNAILNNEGQLFAVYDRMFKMRRRAFPHIKDEQLLYYFYSLDIEVMLDATQHVLDLLDREDESAQELNSWINSKLNSSGVYEAQDGKEFSPVFFHDIKVYQLEETRDIVDFGTARTFAGNKIILDYCYHSKGYSSGNTAYNDTQIIL